jgi:hypothetical protein
MVEHAEHLQVNVPGMVDQVEEHVIFSEMMDCKASIQFVRLRCFLIRPWSGVNVT